MFTLYSNLIIVFAKHTAIHNEQFTLTLFRMGFFRQLIEKGEAKRPSLRKFCDQHLTIMKRSTELPHLKKIPMI